jgi:hypothetical protein
VVLHHGVDKAQLVALASRADGLAMTAMLVGAMLLRCWRSCGRWIALGQLLLHVMHVIHASHGWLLGWHGERWQGNQGRSEE